MFGFGISEGVGLTVFGCYVGYVWCDCLVWWRFAVAGCFDVWFAKLCWLIDCYFGGFVVRVVFCFAC